MTRMPPLWVQLVVASTLALAIIIILLAVTGVL